MSEMVDYIVIASIYYTEIYRTLVENGISRENVILRIVYIYSHTSMMIKW